MKNPIKDLINAKKQIDESMQLIQENTIDSLLRYFQTGVTKTGVHLASNIIEEEFFIEKLLANKLEPMIIELGFSLDENRLQKCGELALNYTKENLVLTFADINPTDRTLRFNFDFTEMDREREVRFQNLERKIKETHQKYKDNRNYIKSAKSGLRKIKYGNIFSRIEETLAETPKEIAKLEKELQEIKVQKILLEDIKSALPSVEPLFRKYGFIIEFVKGEDYEV